MESTLPAPTQIPATTEIAPSSAPSTAPGGSILLRFLKHTLAFILALAMGAGSFWLYTRHNDFPEVYYHPDEYYKADQITGRGSFNFNHPLLMLETARIAMEYFTPVKIPNNPRLQATILGRYTSAGMASVGIVAVALLGYIGYGFVGLLLCGAAVGLCPAMLVNAHFFKEDTSLLCGILLAMLGARWAISASRLWSQLLSAIFLGVACGLAASGKYVGAITILPALAALFIAFTRRWYVLPLRVTLCLICMAVTFRYVNQRAFVPGKAFELSYAAQSGFSDESHHALEGHFGVGLRKPNYFWLRASFGETLPNIWLMVWAGGVWWILRPRFTRWGIAMALFPITFAAVLSFNTIPMQRYALPVTIGIYLIGAQLTSAMLVDWQKRMPRWSMAGTLVCIGAIGLVGGYRCVYLNGKFLDDSRQKLRDWIALSLDSSATILSDNHTGLTPTGDPYRHPDQPRLTQRVSQRRNAADAGSLDSVARSYNYVVVTRLTFGRFFEPEVGGMGPEGNTFDQKRKFYEDLFSRAKLVWEYKPLFPTDGWADTELRLYDLSELKPAK